MIFLLDKYPINKDSTFRSSDDEDAEFIVRRVERNKKKKKYDSEDSD
jgi:predicted glycosyltransferase